MPEPVTDIVVTTRNRPDLLADTLRYIRERTRTPYWLHVIDDASKDDATKELLRMYLDAGRLATLIVRGERAGQLANLNLGAWLSYSDPVVLTDDDVLCPDVSPDWLTRGLDAMRDNPKLGVLALNHPGARRQPQAVLGPVTICNYVGGTFMFVRRKVLMDWPLPHKRHDFGVTPTTLRCKYAREAGWQVGYLTETYCYHTGRESVLTGTPYRNSSFIEPVDWRTLEPPEEFRG